MTTQPILAAILAEKDLAVDPLLAEVAARAGASGFKVAGFFQHRGPDTDECCREIVIECIGSGIKQIISQPLGSGSRGCRLDPRALADVAVMSQIYHDVRRFCCKNFICTEHCLALDAIMSRVLRTAF